MSEDTRGFNPLAALSSEERAILQGGRLDSANYFAVGAQVGTDLVVFSARPLCNMGSSVRTQVSRAMALNLAAWLIVMSGPGGREEVERLIEEIEST